MSVNVWNMLDGRRVVLASASPRRRELMKLLTDDFEIIPADIDESAEGSGAFEAAEMIARRKCMCIAEKLDGNAVVIGCDTVVISPEGELMGKPRDEADALRMLKSLQGAQSWVCSGVCVSIAGKVKSFTEKTAVTFIPPTTSSFARTSRRASRWTRRALTAYKGSVDCWSRRSRAIITTSWVCRWRGWLGLSPSFWRSENAAF